MQKPLLRFLWVLLMPTFVLAQGDDTGVPGIPVSTVLVEQGTIQRITHIRGVIESLNAPLINAKVSAEVIEIDADEGERVRKGDVLARLDDESFRLDKEAAEADIARLKATLANQLLTLKRDEQLFSKGLIPDTRLDTSRTEVKMTRASIVHARALLKKADYQLSHTTVRSPIDGVLQKRLVSIGDYLNPMSPGSKPLFQVVDTAHLRARLFFPDSLAAIVRKGMPVTLIKADQKLSAEISQLRPMIEETSRSFLALVDFTNRYNWLPGASISADVVLDEHPQALLIPEDTLVQRPGGVVVYRVSDDHVTAVKVKTGIRRNGRVEVVDGLEYGDQVVLDGATYLSEGARIAITNGDGESAK